MFIGKAQFFDILFYLLFKRHKVVLNHRPNLVFVHYIISVNDEIPHTDDFAPWRLRTCFTEFFREHICSFANDDQLIDNGKIAHLIPFDLLKSLTFSKFKDVVDTFKNVIKSSFIFSWLSHKSTLCLYQLFPLRKVIACPR